MVAKMKAEASCQAGFSMVEMTVALSIGALIVAATMPALGGATMRARMSATKMNARVLQSVVEGYSTENNGEVPTGLAGYASSNSYQPITNPFTGKGDRRVETPMPNLCAGGSGKVKISKALQKWLCKGINQISMVVDGPAQGGPLGYWNVDPANVMMSGAVGAVLFVPYRNAIEAQAGVSSVPVGGDDALEGFTSYTIQAMGPSELFSNVAAPIPESRITKW